MRRGVWAVFSLVFAVLCVGVFSAECPANADAAASQITKALDDKNIDGFLAIVQCLLPHQLILGKYSFDNKVIPRDSQKVRYQCNDLNNAIKTVMRQWIMDKPIERKSYAFDYANKWTDFFLYVMKGTYGIQNYSDVESKLAPLRKLCEGEGVPLDKTAMGDAEYARLMAAKSETSELCVSLKTASEQDVTRKIEDILADQKGTDRADRIVDILKCLVNPQKNNAQEGGYVPVPGSRCDVWNAVIARIANKYIKEPLYHFNTALQIFTHAAQKSRVKFEGDNFIILDHQQDACRKKRPYREWGTTDRSLLQPVNVVFAIDPDIPADARGDSSQRIELFCLHGTADGSTRILRPGEVSSVWRAGYSEFTANEGLACMLNRGLDEVREYDIENHRTICVSSNFNLRRFGSFPWAVSVTPDNCPYSWIVDDKKSNENNVYVRLAMKNKAVRDGDPERTLRYSPVDPAFNCAQSRTWTAEQGADYLFNAAQSAGTAKQRWDKIQSLFSCLVPLRNVGNLITRKENADCSRLSSMVGKLASRLVAGSQDATLFSMSTAMSVVSMSWGGQDKVASGANELRYWDACKDPKPYKEWGKSTKEHIGTPIRVRVDYSDAQPLDEYHQLRATSFTCLQGVILGEYGNVQERQAYRTQTTNSYGTWWLAEDKYDSIDGFTCSIPLFQKSNCLLSVTLKKFSKTSPFELIQKSLNACPFKYIIASGAEANSQDILIRIIKSESDRETTVSAPNVKKPIVQQRQIRK